MVYIDAITGNTIKYYDNFQTAGPVVGTGTGYYSGGGSLNTYDNDLNYQLRDITRVSAGGPEITTEDEDGAAPSEDSNNNWNNLSTSLRHNNQGAEVDAHRYSADVVDYFQNVHGRNSFDGSGGTLRIISHLGDNYSNGYWDGSKVNLGDGSGNAATGDDYECSDDWLAHEWTHAYTEFSCGLAYLNESGALNEAFSDLTIDSYWENVEFGQDNFIYVRLQNRGASPGDAVVNVYFTAATSFGTPGSWTHVGSSFVGNIAPGNMKIAPAITFASAQIPAPGHYCMIAVVSDALDPAPDHTLISSVSEYLDFVRNTNNISYRNMDVEDLVLGSPGTYSAMIRRIGKTREYFDIDIDLRRFIPEAKVLVKIDSRFILGAKVKGLKLIKRDKNYNVYELLNGGDYKKRRLFYGDFENQFKQEYRFENVLVEKDFPIEILYQTPEKTQIRQKGKTKDFQFSIRQLWKSEEIGAAGLRFKYKGK